MKMGQHNQRRYPRQQQQLASGAQASDRARLLTCPADSHRRRLCQAFRLDDIDAFAQRDDFDSRFDHLHDVLHAVAPHQFARECARWRTRDACQPAP